MSLDILTPKGQISAAQERDAVQIWHLNFPLLRYVNTPKDKASVIDAMLVKDGTLVAVGEMKCRPNVDEIALRTTFKNEWLVTFNKIVRGVEVATKLCVPYVGFLYLPDVPCLMFQTIWKPDEGYCVPFRVAKTATQKTTNGGTAIRDNAYIDMTKAKTIY